MAKNYHKTYIFYSIAFILLIVSGCATRYHPQPSEYVEVSNGYGVVEVDEVTFAISQKRWTTEPHKINDYFTTYHLIVKNNSTGKIQVSAEDITLLDEERNQYDALHYTDVGDILFRDNYRMDKFRPFQENSRISTDELMLARATLMQNSFHYGEIMPNARKTGYIFFYRISPRNQKSTIIFRGKEIDFIKE